MKFTENVRALVNTKLFFNERKHFQHNWDSSEQNFKSSSHMKNCHSLNSWNNSMKHKPNIKCRAKNSGDDPMCGQVCRKTSSSAAKNEKWFKHRTSSKPLRISSLYDWWHYTITRVVISRYFYRVETRHSAFQLFYLTIFSNSATAGTIMGPIDKPRSPIPIQSNHSSLLAK